MGDSEQTLYCPHSLCLLQEDTSGDKLVFYNAVTNAVYPAKAEDTLLASADFGDIGRSKYKNTLLVTAHDPTNPRVRMPCRKCGRKIVSFQRLGDERRVYYVCLCGNQWNS